MLLAVALPIAAYRAAQTSPLPSEGCRLRLRRGRGARRRKSRSWTRTRRRPKCSDRCRRPLPVHVDRAGTVRPRGLAAWLPCRCSRRSSCGRLATGIARSRCGSATSGNHQRPGAAAERRSPPPSQPSVAPRAIAVGGNIRPPRKLVDVKPVYPATMRDAGREGVVPIEAIIGRDGSVTSVRVVTAQVHPDFAIAAARRGPSVAIRSDAAQRRAGRGRDDGLGDLQPGRLTTAARRAACPSSSPRDTHPCRAFRRSSRRSACR